MLDPALKRSVSFTSFRQNRSDTVSRPPKPIQRQDVRYKNSYTDGESCHFSNRILALKLF
jgi:hypothetical protein